MKFLAPLSFHFPGTPFTVSVEAAAWTTMVNECTKAGQYETGGILIGQYSSDGSIALITESTARPSDSLYSYITFQRGTAGLKKLLTTKWSEGYHYVGEWHFHPNGSPEPSTPDVRAMKAISNNPKYSCPEPILMIVGGKPPQNVTVSVTVFPSESPAIRLKPTC